MKLLVEAHDLSAWVYLGRPTYVSELDAAKTLLRFVTVPQYVSCKPHALGTRTHSAGPLPWRPRSHALHTS